jgi:hypothetical protein
MILYCQRRCQIDYTGSSYITAVNQPWAWSIPGWITAEEYLVLVTCKAEDCTEIRNDGGARVSVVPAAINIIIIIITQYDRSKSKRMVHWFVISGSTFPQSPLRISIKRWCTFYRQLVPKYNLWFSYISYPSKQ